LPLFALASAFAVDAARGTAAAQQFRVGGAIQNDAAYDAGLRQGYGSGFRRGDAYGGYPGIYGYESPIGGYMRGYADVVSSVTQGMIDEQQSKLVGEQVKQAQIDTRRKQFDEWLYERDKRPTVEDDRERQRIETIRRARNDPPADEIWSGVALNTILTAIQQQIAQQIQGPTIPVEANVVGRINVTSGTVTGSVGLLRDGGKLTWPAVLQRPPFAEDRQQLDQLARQAYEQAQSGPANGDTVDAMNSALRNMNGEISRQIANLTPNDYSRAKSYLRELEGTVRMLQDPSVANYLTKRWAAKGNTVGEVVDNMTNQGLKFAAATHGDEPAYTAMYRAMVAYLQWNPARPWDTMTK
jgi:hypothetical protein